METQENLRFFSSQKVLQSNTSDSLFGWKVFACSTQGLRARIYKRVSCKSEHVCALGLCGEHLYSIGLLRHVSILMWVLTPQTSSKLPTLSECLLSRCKPFCRHLEQRSLTLVTLITAKLAHSKINDQMQTASLAYVDSLIWVHCTGTFQNWNSTLFQWPVDKNPNTR